MCILAFAYVIIVFQLIFLTQFDIFITYRIHIAFGTFTSFGGVNKAECHMDGIILRPTLYLDDIKVIENGVFLI